jgi:hypothetical protein
MPSTNVSNFASVAARRARRLALALRNPAGERITLHSPELVLPAPEDHAVVQRIFEAYLRMKEAEVDAPPEYRPASIWEHQFERSYAPLHEALRRQDVDPFHYFLANFGAWRDYTGITWSTLHADATSWVRKRALENNTYLPLLVLWEWFYSSRKPVTALDFPRFGNQVGAFIDGQTFVTISSFPMQVYGSLLAGLMRAKPERPVVAELGAGYGNLAYYLISQLKNATYIAFDLPETLCTAAYFLMKTFPERKALLYGEADYDQARHSSFDLIFMPSYSIESVGTKSVDVFLNYASLGEMTADAAANYLRFITRAAEYFFHVNHDRTANIYDDGSRGLLAHEYPVAEEEFQVVWRYPELFVSMLSGSLDLDADSFAHLYRRRER